MTEPTTEKKQSRIKALFTPTEDVQLEDHEYQSLLRKNFYNFDQVKRKRQLMWMRIINFVLIIALIVFLSLYLTVLSDVSFRDKQMISDSIAFVYDNILDSGNSRVYTEVVSELNVIRVLANKGGLSAKSQFLFSELYYISIQVPEAFVNHKSGLYAALKHIHEGRQDIGYTMLEEEILKIVEERK